MVGTEGYIDANVFIYWLGNHPTFGETAYTWIKKIEQAPRKRYATSVLSVYQTLVIVAGLTGKDLRDSKLVEEVVSSIIGLPGLTIRPLTTEEVSSALSLMREYDMDFEDAIHLATALRAGAKEIVSNDKDFDRGPLKRKFKKVSDNIKSTNF
jgi:predicted nucleic acid-binding protein